MVFDTAQLRDSREWWSAVRFPGWCSPLFVLTSSLQQRVLTILVRRFALLELLSGR